MLRENYFNSRVAINAFQLHWMLHSFHELTKWFVLLCCYSCDHRESTLGEVIRIKSPAGIFGKRFT